MGDTSFEGSVRGSAGSRVVTILRVPQQWASEATLRYVQAMNNAHVSPDLELLLSARRHDLGHGMVVGRALPQAACRAVGPVVFLDHMGPSELRPGEGFDVRPHPHTGLATFTYLFEGEIVHRDSLGFVQTIRPGAVNVMIAGHGIVHSERATEDTRRDGGRLHGIQLWIALPKVDEACAPSFVHHPADRFETLVNVGARVRVLLGEAFGARSPVELSSRPFFAVCELERGARLETPLHVDDLAVYVVEGEIDASGARLATLDLGVRAPGRSLLLAALEPSRLVLVGGAHLDGVSPSARGDRSPRQLEWNFVSSTREGLEDAKRRWVRREFPTIPGDDRERIPLPGEREG
ncbi:MAG: pirin family protein [Deltaproteobacteria bacterium]|jgi:redox-sensitive bicupin YhaK (pirin superfamily)